MSEENQQQEVSVEQVGGQEKLVPVSESIRYRRRAQSAEKRQAELEEALAAGKRENEQLSTKLSEVEGEQELVRKLVSAGVSDIESAVLMGKQRLGEQQERDVDGVVEQLRKEKGHLFGKVESVESMVMKTAGAKQRGDAATSTIERAGKRAATSGSRADLQEYLRLRRNRM